MGASFNPLEANSCDSILLYDILIPRYGVELIVLAVKTYIRKFRRNDEKGAIPPRTSDFHTGAPATNLCT